MSSKTLIIIYMIGGFAFGTSLESTFTDKKASPMAVTLSIWAVAAVLILWNVWMYRKAFAAGSDGGNGPTRSKRITNAVAASGSFLVGTAFLFL